MYVAIFWRAQCVRMASISFGVLAWATSSGMTASAPYYGQTQHVRAAHKAEVSRLTKPVFIAMLKDVPCIKDMGMKSTLNSPAAKQIPTRETPLNLMSKKRMNIMAE